jgi:hypothetical protein
MAKKSGTTAQAAMGGITEGGNWFVGDCTPSAGVPLLLHGDGVGPEHHLAADLLEPLQLAHGEWDFAVKGG